MRYGHVQKLIAITLGLWIALGGGVGLLQAQPVRRVTAGFERDVSRYRWVSTVLWQEQFGAWRLHVANAFSSDAYELFQNRLNFRDEDVLNWRLGKDQGSLKGLYIRGRTQWYGQSRVLNQEVLTGARLKGSGESWWVEPGLGIAWDRRPGVALTAGEEPTLRTDAGPAYGAQFMWVPETKGGDVLRVAGGLEAQLTTPRKGQATRINGLAIRNFGNTRISADMALASVRRDAYQATSFLNRDVPTDRLSETIEATVSDTLSITLQAETPLWRKLKVTGRVTTDINNREVRTHGAPAQSLFFDTDFGRQSVEGELGLLYETRDVLTRWAIINGAEAEERRLANEAELPAVQAAQKANLLRQADYDQGNLTLLTRNRVALTRRLTFTLDGSSAILRHDTPDVNQDDRDEVSHDLQFGLQFVFSRYFTADLKVFGNYYHTVYLDETRSAENVVQRSLRMRPAVTWQPSERTRIRLTPEVRSTYTVDDYVLPGRTPSDQSARELRYELEAEHRLANEVRIAAESAVSNLQLGRLLWDDFAEIPFDTLRTLSGRFYLETGRTLSASIGIRYYLRSDYDRAVTVRYPRLDANGEQVLDDQGEPQYSSITRAGRNKTLQLGPVCTINWNMNRASALRLDGWLNRTRVNYRLYGSLPEGAESRIRRAAREGSSRTIPNISLTMIWNL